MEVGKLTVQRRHTTGKGTARQLRAQGLVPGVCYGGNLEAPIHLTLSPKALKASLDPVRKANTVITLTVEDAGKSNEVIAMLKDYTVHPTRRDVTHVDLIAIDPNAFVEVEVPVILAGKFAGLIKGGQLNVVRHEIEVRCLPTNIPNRIDHDIHALDIGDVVHVSDLVLPEGVTAVSSPRLTIATCVATEADAAPAAAAATDAKKEPAKKEAPKKEAPKK